MNINNLKLIIILFNFLFSYSIFSQDRSLSSLKIGTTIPDIPMYTLEDERFTLYEGLEKIGSDKILLLNFTSAYCKPCKIEIPELLKIKEKNDKIELWFIFVGDEAEVINSKVKEFNMPREIKILKDPLQTSLKRLNNSAVPLSFLVTVEKKIATYSVGYTPEKFREFHNQISRIVK
jgi:thiol-disulfide isomerase/thioredoxin